VLLYACFFAQSAFLAQLLYLQCTAECFFVDMENGSHAPTSASHSSGGGGAGVDGDLGSSSSGGAATLAAEASVSAWRRLLVANEWNRFQGRRRTSLDLTLVVLAFAFLGRDLEALAAPQVRPTFAFEKRSRRRR